jgi:predicted signal transduction protein with EAL and GGDEF domain/FixJ family two-component response regulator
MSAPQRAGRVLIADDDAMLREIATAMLENAGFGVRTACSGDTAVAACAVEMPDIALLDVEMPDGDGYQTCANIRTLPGGAEVPIVMVTGLDDPQSIDRAYQAGATDFMIKPINWSLLTHRIGYVLHGARTLEALKRSEQKNATLLRVIPDGIFMVDARGEIGHCFSPIRGLPSPARAPGAGPLRLLDLIPASAHACAMEGLGRALRGAPAGLEFSLPAEDRALRYFDCRFLPKSPAQVLAIMRDVTQRKDAEAHMRRLAYTDALTGLPNRQWIDGYLAEALAQADSEHCSTALLFVDLDQFKRINDTLGHESGDALLAQVARRLRSALGELAGAEHEPRPAGAPATAGTAVVRAQLGRVGGDEFVVVLSGRPSIEEAVQAAQRIVSGFAVPFALAGYDLVVTPSIGIALGPQHGRDARALLKSADRAMYQAKASGGNQVRVHNDAPAARKLARLSRAAELRRALDDGQLQVFYQPKYGTHTLAIAGAEAQVRWFHPELGESSGTDFMAVAHETGLIRDLECWALQQVCGDLCAWRARGMSPGPIAVNVSGREFLRPELPRRLSEIVAQAGLPAALIELELTEGVLMQDAEAGRRSLLALRELGFSVAIDDFGTGHCSLNYLKRFPLDALKIAPALIADLTDDTGDAAIVRAVIALARKLNLRITAAGVATPAQLQSLRAQNCHLIQGSLMGPAVRAPKFGRLLEGADTANTATVHALQLAIAPVAASA